MHAVATDLPSGLKESARTLWLVCKIFPASGSPVVIFQSFAPLTPAVATVSPSGPLAAHCIGPPWSIGLPTASPV